MAMPDGWADAKRPARDAKRPAKDSGRAKPDGRAGRDLWSDAKAAPERTDTDRAIWKLLVRRARPVRWAVLAAPILATVAILMANQALTTMDMMGDVQSTSSTILNDRGRTQAWSYVESWLENGGEGLMGKSVHVVSWNGSDATQVGDPGHTQNARIHHLTCEGSGRWWTVDVTILDDGRVAAQPALTPIPVSQSGSTSASSSGWPGTLSSVDPTPALTAALTKWGQAMVGSDPELLRTLMGDPDSEAVYSPLNLKGTASVKVGAVAYLDRGKVNRRDQTSDYAVARVSVSVDRPTGDSSGGSLQLDFDVLVSGPDAGDPKICAWGAPGSGPKLKEWSNRTSEAANGDLQQSADDQSADAGR